MRGEGFKAGASALAACALLAAGGCALPKRAAPANAADPVDAPADRVVPAVAVETPGAGVVPTVALEDAASTATPLPEAVLAQPPEVLPPTAPASPAGAEPLAAAASCPIDFVSALQIAAGENPEVGFARQRIAEAYAQWRAAEALWVPSLRAGFNYNKHEGRIQDVAGNIIETSRGSIYTGLGAQAVGAGSPAVPGLLVNVRVADAVYQPRINERLLAASRQASRAQVNDTLLETALAYTDLLEALQAEAIAADTLANVEQLAELTGEFARTGQGLPADADRAQAELAARRVEARRAWEAVQVASIRLARVLSQDPAVFLTPVEPALLPIDVVPLECGLPELVATGLSNRPELAESRQLVAAAVERLRRERNAPLIPSVLLGLSYGGNGGGLGGDIENFGDRLDFDAAAYWEIRNLGFGERAARGEARARIEQARWRQVQAMDQAASDVAEAYAQVVARRDQIELSEAGIAAARDSYRRNAERVRAGQGLPIETLQAIAALDQAQRQYARSVADYNRAQFRLQRALGWPAGM